MSRRTVAATAALLAAFSAQTAGATTLSHDAEIILEAPAGPADAHSLYRELAAGQSVRFRPVLPAPPGLIFKAGTPAPELPNSALPPLHKVPLPATLPLYLLAWGFVAGLIGLTRGTRGTAEPGRVHRFRPAFWYDYLRRRVPGGRWMNRYRRT